MHSRSGRGKTAAIVIALSLTILFVRYDQKQRLVSQQVQCMGNLSTIASALHRYLSENGRFPSDIKSPTGERLLSWRVELLTVLDPELYSKFDKSEAWDSPTNVLLRSKMPVWYSCPADLNRRAAGMTSYFAVVPWRQSDAGVEAVVFDLDPYTDSECLLLIESSNLNVPWSQPGDFYGNPCHTIWLAPKTRRVRVSILMGHMWFR